MDADDSRNVPTWLWLAPLLSVCGAVAVLGGLGRMLWLSRHSAHELPGWVSEHVVNRLANAAACLAGDGGGVYPGSSSR